MLSHQRFSTALFVTVAELLTVEGTAAQNAEIPPLRLEAKIPLGKVHGRIDHMAVDLVRHRLFVAELGSDSLAVVDLEAHRLDRLIGALPEPQSAGYDPATDILYVANRGDGSVRLFRGRDLSPAGRIDLGSDADNIRIDPKAGRVFVGHSDGALAIIDASTHDKITDVRLKAHPESFQLDGGTTRVFVNVPNAGAIDVVDRMSGERLASWPTTRGSANFAMAFDPARHRVLVAFRHPAEIGVFAAADGSRVGTVATCGDVDDLFVDPKRDRVYISCGEGVVDVLAADGNSYRRTARITTIAGARTSLFVPEFDRFLLAAPAKGGAAAAIWIFRPSP